MKADVYFNKGRTKILLLVPGTKPDTLPEKGQAFAAGLEFQSTWEIDPDKPRIGLNQKEALISLQEKGYYAATVDIRVEEVDN
jgi:hypothetical protein